MKEYWRDPTDGVVHKILTCTVPANSISGYRTQYIVLNGDEEFWLDDEDVFDEDDEPISDLDRWLNEGDKLSRQMRDEWFLEQQYEQRRYS